MSLNSGSLGQMLQRSGMEVMIATNFGGSDERQGSNDEANDSTTCLLFGSLQQLCSSQEMIDEGWDRIDGKERSCT